MTSTATTARQAEPATRPSPGRPRVGSRRLLQKTGVNVALLAVAAGFVVPLLWLVLGAFNARAGISVSWPHPWTLHNFSAVLNWHTTYRPMINGAILCGGGTAITVACSLLAAYPLSRYRLPGKRPFMLTILFATGLPITAIMVPVYGLFVQVNLIDTLSGTILFMATTALPISIWLTKNFMDGVPIELEQAAWTDGASRMQGLFSIVLPLMWPGVAVVTIFTFVNLWGNFFVPFVLLSSNDQLPASVSIYTFFGQYGQIVYGQLAAFAMLYSLPAVLLYLVLSRRLGGAFSFSGAVKG